MFGSDAAIKLPDSVDKQNATKIFPGFAIDVVFLLMPFEQMQLESVLGNSW